MTDTYIQTDDESWTTETIADRLRLLASLTPSKRDPMTTEYGEYIDHVRSIHDDILVLLHQLRIEWEDAQIAHAQSMAHIRDLSRALQHLREITGIDEDVCGCGECGED